MLLLFLLSVVVEVNDTKSADILILGVRRLTDEFLICLILLRLEAHHCICFQISYPPCILLRLRLNSAFSRSAIDVSLVGHLPLRKSYYCSFIRQTSQLNLSILLSKIAICFKIRNCTLHASNCVNSFCDLSIGDELACGMNLVLCCY